MTFIRAEIKSYLEKLRFKMDGQKLLTLTILRIWTVLARGHCALSFRYKNDSEDFFSISSKPFLFKFNSTHCRFTSSFFFKK